MGVDIERGASFSKSSRYAAAVYISGSFVQHRHLSRCKLVRLIRQYQPELLACDNIHELAPNRRELLAFLNGIAPELKLVQVVGGPRSPSLPALARAHGFSIDRTDPAQEAQACASLAMLGVGYLVEAFEDETVVRISRARSLGRGGWSQNRYRRKVHGSVRAKAREVETTLKELAHRSGVELEVKLTRGFGGYSRAEFVIPLRREKVPVHSQRYADVQVKVEAVGRDKLVLTALRSHGTSHLIVGIDPGTTVGLAALDLEGRFVGVLSERGLSPSNAIEWIRGQGSPVLIASDVLPVPHTVEKIANAFSVQCVGEQLSVEDKRRLSAEFNPSNDHERDATAAAVAAFRRVRNKLAQVEKKAPIYSNIDHIKALVVKGESMDSAILKSSRARKSTQKPPRQSQQPPRSQEEFESEIRKLRKRLAAQKTRSERLMRYNEELKQELSHQSQHTDRLRRRLQEVKQKAYIKARETVEYQRLSQRCTRLKRTIGQKDTEIAHLKERIASLMDVKELEMREDLIPVKPIERFTKEAITDIAHPIERGDVLYIRDASGGGKGTAELLASLHPRAVLFDEEMSHSAREVLLSRQIPLLRAEGLVRSFDEVLAVSPEVLDAKIDAWQSELAAYTRQVHERMLDEIVGEYRSERLKESRKD